MRVLSEGGGAPINSEIEWTPRRGGRMGEEEEGVGHTRMKMLPPLPWHNALSFLSGHANFLPTLPLADQ